jgi:hypothetical protein
MQFENLPDSLSFNKFCAWLKGNGNYDILDFEMSSNPTSNDRLNTQYRIWHHALCSSLYKNFKIFDLFKLAEELLYL